MGIKSQPKRKFTALKLFKTGCSLLSIALMYSTSTDTVLRMLSNKTNLPVLELEKVLSMKESGIPTDQISQVCNISLNVLHTFLPDVVLKAASPKCIFSCNFRTYELHRTALETGIKSFVELPNFVFHERPCWCILADGKLFIVGGYSFRTNKIFSINTLKEFSVVHKQPMLFERFQHGLVSHANYLYVAGGSTKCCERYNVSEDSWEEFESIQKVYKSPLLAVLERYQSLFAIGGRHSRLIQRLSLLSLTWNVVDIRLPYVGAQVICFKFEESQLYLILNKALYVFQPEDNNIQLIRSHIEVKDSKRFLGWGYYKRGYLHFSNDRGPSEKLKLVN